MPRGRIVRPRGGSRQARRMEWLGAAVNQVPDNVAAGGIQTSYMLLPSQAEELTDPTLIRTRGIFKVFLASSATTAWGAFGLIPWSDINDAEPTESIPDPFVDAELDWLYHTFWFVEGGATIDARKSFQDFMVDSKAMRRLGTRRGVLAVARNAAAGAGSGAVRFYYALRFLVKE